MENMKDWDKLGDSEGGYTFLGHVEEIKWYQIFWNKATAIPLALDGGLR